MWETQSTPRRRLMYTGQLPALFGGHSRDHDDTSTLGRLDRDLVASWRSTAAGWLTRLRIHSAKCGSSVVINGFAAAVPMHNGSTWQESVSIWPVDAFAEGFGRQVVPPCPNHRIFRAEINFIRLRREAILGSAVSRAIMCTNQNHTVPSCMLPCVFTADLIC